MSFILQRYAYVIGLIMMIGFSFSCLTLDNAKLSKAELSGAPIYVGDIRVGLPNSADGKSISMVFKNLSNRSMKYVTIRTTLKNNVNDRVTCSYGYSGGIKFTGPFKSGQVKQGTASSLCYDSTAKKAVVYSVSITYMDNTFVSFSREQLLELNAISQ